MEIKVPIQLSTEFADEIAAIVIKHVEYRLSVLSKSIELPPYPNKSEVKRLLSIGDDKLSRWISLGLKVQIWSEKDIRIERSELQRFLKENFEV